jgi:hypothetical protein
LAVLVGFSFHQFFDDLLVHGMEVQIGLIMAAVTRAGYGQLGAEGSSVPGGAAAPLLPEPAANTAAG